MELILGILGSILVSLLANEVYDRGPTFARKIIQMGAKRLPDNIRARYEEEWLAHLDECQGKLSKLCHGLECFICARSLGKIAQNEADSPVDISMDADTAKYFFAIAVKSANRGLASPFWPVWVDFSGQNDPPTEEEMKALRKSADIDLLEKLFAMLNLRLKGGGSTVGFRIKVVSKKVEIN